MGPGRRSRSGFFFAPRRTARLVAAVSLAALLAVGVGGLSTAQPSRRQLAGEEAELARLNERLSLLVEEYNRAALALEEAEEGLSRARLAAEAAAADAEEARDRLSARAAAAYRTAGSTLEVLLGATSFAEFSDRLEFVSRTARQDADAALAADQAGRRAERAAERLAALVQARERAVAALEARKAQIQDGIAEQQALVARIREDIARREAEARARAAAEARAQAAAEAAQQAPAAETGVEPPGGGDPPPAPEPEPRPDPPDPPPVGSGADAAIAAARSVIGVPYVWGGSSPSEGFDCSGLTSWAWGRAGVSLPHSSAAQYGVLPRVARDQLQPGDLLFFYSPIHHVAMYLGGNAMIHADHPGSTVHIESISSYYWDVYVGAGRPG